jgi:predicted Rossmann fold nucleotide-binding protein DprA/Smf involved in DNA uptake
MGRIIFQNLPIPNCIISAMSVGVLAVKGAQSSGSVITAEPRYIDRGRGVFGITVLPSKLIQGPNLLIKQGTRLGQDRNKVIAELPSETRRHLRKQGVLTSWKRQGVLQLRMAVTHPYYSNPRIWALWPAGPPDGLQVDAATHLDDLLEKIQDTSPTELIAALFGLEAPGLVKQLAGKELCESVVTLRP